MFVSIFWQKMNITLAIPVLAEMVLYVQRKKSKIPVFSFAIDL